ncbi:hypothetical protein ACIGO6_34510 [Streptomyces sp. NPDC053750]|uniref:hypothetical protein n=1 Tax=Streptomyces sp. NPDC053750 TaxID=3365714 RepID=UPI0037D87905
MRTANPEAVRRRNCVEPDDLDGLGGLLTYSPEQQAYCTVESEALLGHGNTDLTAQAEQAVQGQWRGGRLRPASTARTDDQQRPHRGCGP